MTIILQLFTLNDTTQYLNTVHYIVYDMIRVHFFGLKTIRPQVLNNIENDTKLNSRYSNRRVGRCFEVSRGHIRNTHNYDIMTYVYVPRILLFRLSFERQRNARAFSAVEYKHYYILFHGYSKTYNIITIVLRTRDYVSKVMRVDQIKLNVYE